MLKKSFIKTLPSRTYHTAVNVEPPVADKVLLVVEGAIGAEQGGDGCRLVLRPTDVISLAVSLLVCVVTIDQARAGEGGWRHLAKHWVVLPRLAGNCAGCKTKKK